MVQQPIRVRFAPSPTGPFHIGGARSALFNWLLVRKLGGTFVLRIEDTDLERSSRESEENIKVALHWLGLSWDEGVDIGGPYGPYRQTERLEIYKEYTDKLLKSGQAYYCFCTEEEIEAERASLMAKEEMPLYSGKCRNLSKQQQAKLLAEGRKPTVRFHVPENQQIIFKDLVRGTVSFDSNGVGDFVIVKSDGIPVYNFAVVLDDSLMKITHVIRAEEHLSNTPRQILIYEALGFPLPAFGHISLILGKDRTKMSKRHGATSVQQYKDLGYLPEAIDNFLALLGWAPSGEEEIFTLDELVQQFSMEHVAKNPAVFDIDKLNWINAHYIRQATPEKVLELAWPHLTAAGYVDENTNAEQKAWLVKVTAVLQEHISYGAELVDHIGLFFQDDFILENEEAQEVLKHESIPQVMHLFKEKLRALDVVDEVAVKKLIKSITKELKLGGKYVYMPIRVALTGQMHGPELISMIPLLGVERTLSRIEQTLAKCN
jgi:nondiscriminating glutamyl-tRNA synthetase